MYLKLVLCNKLECVQKKAYKWKLELFCLMESNAESPIHPILEEVIMRSIMEAIDIMQADEVCYYFFITIIYCSTITVHFAKWMHNRIKCCTQIIHIGLIVEPLWIWSL